MNKEATDCEPLIRCTTNALDEVELQKLVVSAQQVNFDMNIELAARWEEYLTYWKMHGILMILRSIMEQAKEKIFRKRLVELEIFEWMPFKQVRGLYYQVWALI